MNMNSSAVKKGRSCPRTPPSRLSDPCSPGFRFPERQFHNGRLFSSHPGASFHGKQTTETEKLIFSSILPGLTSRRNLAFQRTGSATRTCEFLQRGAGHFSSTSRRTMGQPGKWPARPPVPRENKNGLNFSRGNRKFHKRRRHVLLQVIHDQNIYPATPSVPVLPGRSQALIPSPYSQQ